MASSIDYTRGPARIDLTGVDAAEIDHRKGEQILVEDLRRTRANYFDGRFLTAKDLTREQTYALTREADVASAYHGGVLRGLVLTQTGDQLRLAPGAGFTPSGELVSLSTGLTVAIQQVPEDDLIDLSNGLVDVAEPPAKNRTGFYIVGIRPGEYATRPITRFPLTTRGTPGREDGDIVEALALALHPLRVDAANDPTLVRSSLARSLFFENGSALPPDLLALAVVYLSGGSIRWFDPYLVRREVAAEDAVPIGIGAAERALREAHFLQYDRQLAELVTDLRARGGLKFPASRYFRCLPPIGRMPLDAIDPSDFTCAYFPPQMTVTLSVVVDEELPALLEQSFDLPVIDLEGADDDFDFTYIQVLVPMPASQIARLRLAAVEVTRPIALPVTLARRLPVAALRDFLVARKPPPGPDFGSEQRPESAPLLAAWRQALAAAPDRMVWFARVPALSIAPASLFDPPPKSKEKEKEKEKEKDKDKEASADKAVSDKTEEKVVADKPDAADKAAIADKLAAVDKAVADKPDASDKTVEKTFEKAPAAEKAIADKQLDKVVEKQLEKQPDKVVEKTVEKQLEKSVEKTVEKTVEKQVEKTFEKASDKQIEKQPDKTVEKQLEKQVEKQVEKTVEKTFEKVAAADKAIADKTTDGIKVREVIAVPHDVATPAVGTSPTTPTPTPVEGTGRTFIQPTERPDVGTNVIRKTRDT